MWALDWLLYQSAHIFRQEKGTQLNFKVRVQFICLKFFVATKSLIMKPIPILSFVVIAFICACNSGSSVREEIWGESGGVVVKIFTLTNKNGMIIKVSNYGGTLSYVSVPDRNGNFEPVVLGFDSLKMYQGRHPLFGATVGRFANRISGAGFSLNGNEYRLTANNQGNTLHGGAIGFNRKVFSVDTSYVSNDSSVVVLEYLSPDLEEGFPGTLRFRLSYVLTGDNEIIIYYEATTDKSTVVNFTNHSYFNLSGCSGPVLNQILMVAADSITEVDSKGLPTGMVVPVAGTPYDFTQAREVGERIEEVTPGYDINFKLRKSGDDLSLAAEVFDPGSGRLLQAYTTEPGMQLYSANRDLSPTTGHNGITYGKYYGICLEMQHFPDSPNKPQFPSVVLEPGEKYKQVTIYKFTIQP